MTALPRLRFTIRRMLFSILVLALLLTGYVEYRDLIRREAMSLQTRRQMLRLDTEIENERNWGMGLWQKYRAGYASLDEVRAQDERVHRLANEGKALVNKLDGLYESAARSACAPAGSPSPRPSHRRGEGDRLSPPPRPTRSAEGLTIPFSPAGRRCPKGG